MGRREERWVSIADFEQLLPLPFAISSYLHPLSVWRGSEFRSNRREQ